MKVVVTNTALANTGDAAIMLGTAEILRRALGDDLTIALRDQQPGAAGDKYPEFEVRPVLYDRLIAWTGTRLVKPGMVLPLLTAVLWRTPLRGACLRLMPRQLRDDLADLASADLVVSAGGTYLVPHYRISPKLADLMVAAMLGTPYVLFTQSLGPFHGGGNRLLKFVLRRARLILVRDPRSQTHLEEIGIDPTRVFQCADAAFAIAPPRSSPVRQGRRPRLKIAISVRHWPHFKDDGDNRADAMESYRCAMTVLVRHLVDVHHARVTFISTCQGVETYWTDDSRVAEDIVAGLPGPIHRHIKVDNRFHRPEALLSILGGFDMVVATRMHAAILALVAGVPVLPIAYEFKTRELFTRLGFDDLVIDMDTLSATDLCRTADTILADRPGLRHDIAVSAATMRWSAFAASRRINSILENAA